MIGLYRDDGLAALNTTPREIERAKKHICKIFSEHNLRITIEANKKHVDYLDVTLDLRSESFKPFTKPNNIPRYVHRFSNHPPSILENIPEAINRRLSNISSDSEAFESATPPYQEALKQSGYDYRLNFKPEAPKPKRRNRERNITWFNPPYSANVKTNIGRKFLQIIDDCFTVNHSLRKIFNRNTLKLSYSCMPSISKIITAHNKSLLKKEYINNTEPVRECNCRKKNACPLSGKCQTKSLVYQATVAREDNGHLETYVGLTENSFKTRYSNHMSSFRIESKQHSTELSKYIWQLKNLNIQYTINWKIMKQCNPYSSKTKRCNLCLHEKFLIICHPEKCTLNSKNELVSACRHRKKHLLCKH